ncbi:transcription elongation factor, mitochondrial [Rhinophrynus dorsalis]
MIGSLEVVLRAGRNLLLRPHWRFRHVNCSRCLAHSLVGGDLEEKSSLSNPAESDPFGSLNKAYTQEQADAILHILNSAPESELAKITLLRGKRSASIVQYRQEYGPFLDLDSLLSVPHLKHKVTVKVFDAILNLANREVKRERRLDSKNSTRFIKPEISEDRLSATQSIVSIVFGIRKLAWAHVDRGLTVWDWQQEEWHRFMKGPYLPHVYLEDISSAVSKLPRADLYVLEKPGISIQNSNLFPVTLHLRTVEAMLYCMLNTRYNKEGEHCVLSMVRNTVGKHFDLMVGDSRTSGLEIVKQLLTESAVHGQSRVCFPPDLVYRYRSQFQTRGQNRSEEMCDALLQAIAFYELLF